MLHSPSMLFISSEKDGSPILSTSFNMLFAPRMAKIYSLLKLLSCIFSSNVSIKASLSDETLAKILRCESDEIFVICQEQNFPQNLTIKQVPIGYLGVNRGNDQSKRAEAAIAAIYRQNPNAKVDLSSSVAGW